MPKLRALRGSLHEWVGLHAADLARPEPDLPAEDRAADVWEPLVAIADAAGGDWPDRARKACQELTGAASEADDGTAGERLLADLRGVFGPAGFLYSATIDRRARRHRGSAMGGMAAHRGGTGADQRPRTGRAAEAMGESDHAMDARTAPAQVGKGYYAEDMDRRVVPLHRLHRYRWPIGAGQPCSGSCSG